MYFITFIVKNLTRRPVRTVLTILGLAVAVGSMVSLLSISHNVTRSVEELFERRGVALMVTAAGKQQASSDMNENLVAEARNIPGVRGAAAGLIELVDATSANGNSQPALVMGWGLDNFGFEDLEIKSGRNLIESDSGNVMLGTNLAANLGKNVGDEVLILQVKFQIIGIFSSPTIYETGAAIMLLTEAQKLLGRPKRVTGFSVRVDQSIAKNDVEIAAVGERIEALRDPVDLTLRLTAQNVKEYIDKQTQMKIVRAMCWMVSTVALLIGVISMLNTMIMAVMERTQEIGILRAVGWPRSRVMKMVIGESIILGLLAAVVGSAGAFLMTYLLTLSPKVNGFIEGGIAPIVLAEGLGLTALIGLLGGTYPAIRAARLLPTEAIRHD